MKHSNLLMLAAFSFLLAGCEGDTIVVVNGSNVPPPDQFAFRSDHISAYTKVDRMGGPATTTALLMPGAAGGARRQQANLTEPADDAQYAAEYISTLRTLHYELGPALTGLNLTPCGIANTNTDQTIGRANTNVDQCVAQAAPVVIPDVLRLNTSVASGFPNGRDLDDRVVDIVLAVGLLDLRPGAMCFGVQCGAATLANLPLNPGMSNPAPLTQFPYFNNQMLAPPPPASP